MNAVIVWNAAAGRAVVHEAGGHVIDAGRGQRLRYNKKKLQSSSFVAFSDETYDTTMELQPKD